MHGFGLVLKSVLAYPWAKDLVMRAQQLVTYFRASHAPLAALRAAAKELGITKGLQSSNTTRMTSSYSCTSSVQAHHPAFTRMSSSGDVQITNRDVTDTLEDAAFWASLSTLNKVLSPICRAIMVVQGDQTTLADVSRCASAALVCCGGGSHVVNSSVPAPCTISAVLLYAPIACRNQMQVLDAVSSLLCRCWLYLADALGKVLAPLPEGFQTHIIWAFSTRAKQQDQPLCRLALFLDPRYRQAALRSSSNSMAAFVEEAAKFGYLQGWDEEKINQLLSQLSKYSSYHAPFGLPASGIGFSPRMWWSTVGQNADGAVLGELAGVLLDVVPHAAGPERVFSQMGWYEGSTSISMNTDTTAKKVAIKLHYARRGPDGECIVALL